MSFRQLKRLGPRYRTYLQSSRFSTAACFSQGDKLHGYIVNKVKAIPERRITAYFLTHDTGAEHIHMAADDLQNSFSVGFKTVPQDSSGVAHILEHTVLCGSKKYPVRDPFFNMLKRVVQTYMNAWTASDFTMYPFSTVNEASYSHLMSVYLDAVFFPNLASLDFAQEGHHLGYKNENDRESLEIKGVVYNEMKGAMSDPNSLFCQNLQTLLHPSSTYHHNSGGEPADIPNLTYEQLKEFHTVHYHPSNAYFCTYGNFPLEKHLQKINEWALSNFSKESRAISIGKERRLEKPVVSTVKGPHLADFPDRQFKVSTSYLTTDIRDTHEVDSLNFLSLLLTSGPSSPMYQSLILPGIAMAFCPATGLDTYCREPSLALGASFVKKEDVEQVQEILKNTLEEVARTGFQKERIEGFVQQSEFSMKHIVPDYGIALSALITSRWIHGVDPEDLIGMQRLDWILDNVYKKNFFQDLVRKHLLENKHSATLIMEPDEEFSMRLAEDEAKKIATLRGSMTDKDHEIVEEAVVNLANHQATPQDMDCLPTMSVEDLSKEVERTQIDFEHDRAELQWCDGGTPSLTYMRGYIPLPAVALDTLPLLNSCFKILGNVDTENYDYKALALLQEQHLGKLSFSAALNQNPETVNEYTLGLYFGGAAFDRKLDHLFHVIEEVLHRTRFSDFERVSSIIKEDIADMQESIVASGQRVCLTHANSAFGNFHAIKEHWGGYSHLQFMQQLIEMDPDMILEEYRKAFSILQSPSKYSFVTTERELVKKYHSKLVSTFTDPVPGLTSVDGCAPLTEARKRYLGLPVSVNFVGQSLYTGLPVTHDDLPKLQVLTKILTHCFLLPEVREKGGAYGAGSFVGNGLLNFYSYRDPHLDRTLDTFQQSSEWIKAGNISQRDIDEAKIGLFSSDATPLMPSSRGARYFKTGITDEQIERHRSKLLGVTLEDLMQAADEYLDFECPSTAAVVPESFATENKDTSWSSIASQ